MGVSGGSSKSTPKDMTPQPFKNLQGPLADVVAGLLGYGKAGQTQAPAPVAQTPATTNTGYNRGSPWSTARNQRGEVGQQNPLQQIFNPTPNPAYVPKGDPNDPLRGIPGYEGQLVAPITGNEQSLLDQLMGMTGGNSGTNQAQSILEQLLAGGPRGTTEQFTGLSPDAQYTPEALADFAARLQGARQVGNYDPNTENPFLAAAIEAAQRPTQQALEETLSRTLPGRFTAAGQFVQSTGSSAFDRAAAIATRGAADALGDIATNISYAGTEAQLARAFEAQQATQAQEMEGLFAELARQGAFGESEREAVRAAEEAERNRQFQGEQAERDRQLEATQQLAQLSSQEIQDTIANLQAQALPRLIQEFGIERGIEQFNNRMNSLLVLLQTAGGVTQPVIANEQRSSQFGLNMGK